ncbi:MAG: hypothetical protein RJB38_1499 [Pseudomonadota bacterium]|jgi:D-lactate dehydrogenase
MKILFFDSHRYERLVFDGVSAHFEHHIDYLDVRLTEKTAPLAAGYDVICAFVNDRVNAEVLTILAQGGVRLVALRSAGFNHVDLEAAHKLGVRVVRVPEYSPHAVAEHAVALLLGLVRKIPRAHARVREGNFSLDGLEGFDLFGKTVGVVGTGRIGRAFAKILLGFGCQVFAYDQSPDPQLAQAPGLRYVSLAELFSSAKIISLHVPLTPSTKHLIDDQALSRMQDGVILLNTGRGALIDTRALIDGLKTGKVGGAALDVYEEEEGVFFEDLSNQVLQDDILARLLTFPNVLLTSHQAFLTHEALVNIAETTLKSVSEYAQGLPLTCEVQVSRAGSAPRLGG